MNLENSNAIVQDKLGRQFKSLRLSVTPDCNFACFYCKSVDSLHQKKNHSLSVKEYIRLIKSVLKYSNLNEVRITGGEPTLYKPLVHLVKEIKKLKPTLQVNLTSNGRHLKSLIKSLKEAGLDSVNISLDALDEKVFTQITRRPGVIHTIQSIQKAVLYELPVKINCTVMKGINEEQVLPLLDFAIQNNVVIRFLEFMKMGSLYYQHKDYFFPEKNILEIIQRKYSFKKLMREKSSTSNYWQITSLLDKNSLNDISISETLKFGIIANHSSPFCHDCDRLRIDSQGHFYGCLSVNEKIELINHGEKQKENNDTDVKIVLEKAIAQKQKDFFTGSSLSMQSVGG